MLAWLEYKYRIRNSNRRYEERKLEKERIARENPELDLYEAKRINNLSLAGVMDELGATKP